MNRRFTLLAILVLGASCLSDSPRSNEKPARADDWPVWRHDPQRSAFSKLELASQLHLQWAHDYPPQKTAWLDQPHMVFDRIPEPVVRTTLFFGSARNDTLTALETRTGIEKWVFHADGPIRFAPAAWEEKVYFVSDDGCLYCLEAGTGKLLWKFRGGPSDRRILGNGRLISTWPARGAPVLADGVVYFAAGIWPMMGIFLHALDARTGKVIWTNDGDSSPYMKQPHNSDSFAGIAPQGCLVVQGDRLLIPGGRSVPACYDRHTGKMLHYRLAENNKLGGGSEAAVLGNLVFNGGIFDLPTGLYLGPFGKQPPFKFKTADEGFKTGANSIAVGKLPVLADDVVVGHSNGKYQLFNPKSCKVEIVEGKDVRGNKTQGAKFTQAAVSSFDAPARLEALIRSGSRLYAASPGKIEAIDLAQLGEKGAKPVVSWETRVTGTPVGLLSADGRLFAVTLEGQILCFGAEKLEPRASKLAPRLAAPDETWGNRARTILETSKVRDGYCLVWGVGTGQLLMELARQSNLSIIAVDPDVEKVQQVRRQLIAAGLYGERIAVHAADPAAFPFPPYLASLIVSEDLKAARFDASPSFARKLFHGLRPFGGVACLEVPNSDRAPFRKMIAELALPNARIQESSSFVLVTREGALPGSGNWTHEHADPANTRVSRDQIVKAPLGILWFGGTSNEGILPRHGHGPQPQVIDGRLIIEGLDTMRAMDIYTGRILWESRLPGVGKVYNNMAHQPGANATGSNYVSTSDGIYVVNGKSCLRLDVATGKPMSEFQLPTQSKSKGPPSWGYLNVCDDVLVGGADPLLVDARDEALPRQLQLWNVAERKVIATLEGHTDQVAGLAFSPDGNSLATTSADKTVRLWNARTGKLLHVLDGHTKGVICLSFSPDGKTLATGSEDASVILWDLASKKVRARLKEHTGSVASLAFSPDGKLLATGSTNSTVILWDANGEKMQTTLEGLTGDLTCVQFSPDSKWLATGSTDRTVRIWDVATKDVRVTLEKHKDTISSIAFAPDGKTLATGSRDKSVELWDVVSGRPLGDLQGQASPVTCLTYAPDGKTLAVGTLNATIYLWDPIERKVMGTLTGLPGSARSVAFAPDGKTLAMGGSEVARKTPNENLSSSKQLVVMDRQDGRVLWSIEAHNGFRHNAICMGGGRLYCVDMLSAGELTRMKRRGQTPSHKPRLLALDLRTGKEVWSTEADVFGTWLSYSAKHDVLVEAGRQARDTLWDEAKGMRAYRAGNGTPLWYEKTYLGPAMIHGDTILKDQSACDLLTGKPKMREDPITGKPVPWTWTRNYGCNTPVASEHLMTFRSGAAGYCDLANDGGTGNFGGFRSSCTNNLIVAGGLLNAPDYTRACTCSYQNQASLALVPMPEVEIWTRFPIGPVKPNVYTQGTDKPATPAATPTPDRAPKPIKHIGLTLGAPGHRRADNGLLWLNDYELLQVQFDRFGPYTGHSSKIVAAGGSWPWVVASGCRGISQLVLPIKTDGPGTDGVRYTVRLHFADPDNDKPGQRVFGVAIQDEVVLPRLDIAGEAGGRNRGLVKEFKGVKVLHKLEIRFVPKEGLVATPASVPLLSGLEVLREDP